MTATVYVLFHTRVKLFLRSDMTWTSNLSQAMTHSDKKFMETYAEDDFEVVLPVEMSVRLPIA